MLRPAALAVLALLAAGCAQVTAAGPADPAGPTPGPSGPPSAPTSPGAAERLIGRGTVIDEGSGPRLCLMVLQSLPPQCGAGVELAGWRWPEQGVERSAGTTWGDFAVVGSYDGRRFRVLETVEPASSPEPGDTERRGTPCPEPTGGWRAPDPDRATHETQEQAIRLAERLPGHGDTWVEELETSGGPRTTVLNFSFTEDLAGAERALREVWGGPLCVSRAERSHAELARIHRDLERTPGLLGSSFGFGRVDLTVIHDDGTLQRRLDQEYGDGLVKITSFLEPYAE